MRLTRAAIGFLLLEAVFAPAQAQQYTIATYAGGAPPPTPVLTANKAIGVSSALATDNTGNLYFVSFNCVFRLDHSGAITRVAGISPQGYSGDGGPALNAQQSRPGGLAVDNLGNLFIADLDNHRVRKVSPDGIITTVAGNGIAGFSGDGGPAIDAELFLPATLAVDGAGNLFILDLGNPYAPADSPGALAGSRVRKVSADGTITTVAGNGIPGYAGDGGLATAAQLNLPGGIAADNAGNLFIADTYNQRIRRVSSDGVIATVVDSQASNPDCVAAVSPFGPFGKCGPASVAVDPAGNLFFEEFGFDDFMDAGPYLPRLRKLSPDGTITTLAGTDVRGYSGDGGPAVDARISPAAFAVNAAGELFFSDALAHIRKISSDGIITTVAGNGEYYPEPVDGIPATSAHLNSPTGVALDSSGNLFIKEASGIRKVSASGIVTTVVTGVPCGYSYVGPANVLTSNTPGCIGGAMAADSSGSLFFQEYFRVRKVSPDGAILTVAGNGTGGYSGDGGPATAAQLSSSVDSLAVDGAGNLFIADDLNRRVRKVTPDGIISTVAGDGALGHSGDGGQAVSAELYAPTSVAVGGAGDLWIAELGSIRKVSPGGIIQTITANGGVFAAYSGDGPASGATGVWGPLALDGAGNLFIASGGHIRKISPEGTITTVADGLTGSPIAADSAGNIYVVDSPNNLVRILRPVNSPF